MKLYKLTDSHGRTYNDTQWGPGVTHEASGEGELCGPGWLHAYTDPLLAMFMNPAHANFKNPRMWEAEGEVGKNDHGLKVGCTKLTTVREIEVPKVTPEQRVRFAILCARTVCEETCWNKWAEQWLATGSRSTSVIPVGYQGAWGPSADFAAEAARLLHRGAAIRAYLSTSALWAARTAEFASIDRLPHTISTGPIDFAALAAEAVAR